MGDREEIEENFARMKMIRKARWEGALRDYPCIMELERKEP